MLIKVRLFAMLRDKLPADSNGEEIDVEVDAGATASQIIDRLEIPVELAHLVTIDGFHLLPDEIKSRTLQAGEILSIFPPVAGG